MATLLNALQTEDTTTLNGMVTNSTSKDANVDLFFHIGAMRGKDPVPVFAKAFAEDPLTALKVMFWCRDVRGGAGERQLFKDVVIYLSLVNQDVLKKNMHLFSLYGRWDDLFVLLGTIIKHGLQDKIEPIFNEIHRSNMSKLDDEGNPIYNEEGKVLKGKNYKEPDLSILV